jgi:membrane protease YdiL (CAAX protease family)
MNMQPAKVTKNLKFFVTFAPGMERNRISGWVVLGVMAAIFFGATIAGALFATPLTVALGGIESEIVTFVSYTAAFSLAVAGGALWLWRKGELRLRLGVDLSAAPMVLLGVVLLTAASIVIEPLLLLFPEKWFEQLSRMIGRGGWAILTTVVAAPVLEELFMRGLLLETLSRRWRLWVAVVVSAAFFGVVHINPPQAINAFVAAVVMGYIYLASGSLIAVIVIHAVNNGLSYLSLEVFGSQLISTREMIGNDTLYYTVFGASAVILVVSMVFLVRRARAKNREIGRNSGVGSGGCTKNSETALNTKTADV